MREILVRVIRGVGVFGGLLPFSLVGLVYGQSPAQNCQVGEKEIPGLGCIPTNDPLSFAGYVYGIGLGFIGMVALIFIMWGGYLVLTSQGSADQIRRGKKFIYYAIAGMILGFAGFAFYQVIARDIFKIPGF